MAKLHLVFGGVLKNPNGTEFQDVSKIDIIGIFPSYEDALIAWRSASQKAVDSALTRYFVADLTKLRETSH